MSEEEKYRRKTELLKRALRFADELDQTEADSEKEQSGTYTAWLLELRSFLATVQGYFSLTHYNELCIMC